jgi:hypothetical protein
MPEDLTTTMESWTRVKKMKERGAWSWKVRTQMEAEVMPPRTCA